MQLAFEARTGKYFTDFGQGSAFFCCVQSAVAGRTVRLRLMPKTRPTMLLTMQHAARTSSTGRAGAPLAAQDHSRALLGYVGQGCLPAGRHGGRAERKRVRCCELFEQAGCLDSRFLA